MQAIPGDNKQYALGTGIKNLSTVLYRTTPTTHSTIAHIIRAQQILLRGWIEAGNLNIGNRVQRLDGTFTTVIALQIMPGEMNMYDLSVSNVHTFAVGHTEIIVHNTYPCGGKLPSVSKKQVYSALKHIKDSDPKFWYKNFLDSYT